MTPRTAARRQVQRADLARAQALNTSSGAIHRSASRSFLSSSSAAPAPAPAAANTPRPQAQHADDALPSYRRATFVPMSRDPRGPSAARAHAVGGISPGYMGFVPGVANHYGSTHVGGTYERTDASLPGRSGAALSA